MGSVFSSLGKNFEVICNWLNTSYVGSGGSRRSSSKKSSSPVKKYPKKDAASQLAALQIRTYGVACVPVNMAALFSTEITSTTAKLEKPAGSVKDVMITVSLDRPLLSSEQLNTLNPMVIKVQDYTPIYSTIQYYTTFLIVVLYALRSSIRCCVFIHDAHVHMVD